MFWPKKVCFCDVKSPKHIAMFSETSHVILTLENVKIFLFSLKPGKNGLGEAFKYSFIT